MIQTASDRLKQFRYPKGMKISILAVGTELTEGQILNRNAVWLSQRFQTMGFSTQTHLTVPDERRLILNALQFLEHENHVIVVTGGLGPTSDDFTRDVVAEWAGQKLEWREEAWAHIHERLGSRGIAVRDIQKQQCYFPSAAKILRNSVGTAHGFALEKDKLQVFVLPGPPREIEDIWNRDLEPWFQSKAQAFELMVTKSWDCLGSGESQIAELTEQALQGAPCEIGYRVHLPYVEIKARFLKKNEDHMAPFFQKLELALGDLFVLRDGLDPAKPVSQALLDYNQIILQDDVCEGQFLKRLFLQEPRLFSKSLHVGPRKTRTDPLLPGAITLILENSSEGKVKLSVTTQDFNKEHVLSPHVHYVPLTMHERRQQYFTEKALIALMEIFE